MKTLLIAIYLNIFAIGAFAQQPVKYFELSDSVFEVGAICKLENIYFSISHWGLRPESYAELDSVVNFLNKFENITIEMGSHTDFRPIPITNDTLSLKRSEWLINYLIEKGINEKRLEAKGYAERIPYIVRKKDSEKYPFLKEGDVLTKEFIKNLPTIEQQEGAHQLNRRTELKILSIE